MLKNKLLKHILIRISIIIITLLLSFGIILKDRSDPMGYGTIYSIITAFVFSLLFLIIDSVILYKKDFTKELNFNTFLLILIIISFIFLFN